MRPGQALVREHFHTIRKRDGTKDVHVEELLSRHEHLWAHVVRKILQNIVLSEGQFQNHVTLTQEEVKLMKQLVFVQFWRSPDNYGEERMNEILEDSLSSFEKEFGVSVLDLPPEQALSREDLIRIKDNARISSIVGALKGEPSSSDIVMSKNLSMLTVLNPKKSFISGSHPVVNNSTEKRPLYHPESCLFLPISSTVLLQLIGNKAEVSTINDGAVFPAEDQWVRSLNISITGQSETIVGRSKQLIESLCRIR